MKRLPSISIHMPMQNPCGKMTLFPAFLSRSSDLGVWLVGMATVFINLSVGFDGLASKFSPMLWDENFCIKEMKCKIHMYTQVHITYKCMFM